MTMSNTYIPISFFLVALLYCLCPPYGLAQTQGVVLAQPDTIAIFDNGETSTINVLENDLNLPNNDSLFLFSNSIIVGNMLDYTTTSAGIITVSTNNPIANTEVSAISYIACNEEGICDHAVLWIIVLNYDIYGNCDCDINLILPECDTDNGDNIYPNYCFAECVGQSEHTSLCFFPFSNENPQGNWDECNCGDEYDPVCGEDNNIYSNPCFAECAQVAIVDFGENCIETTPPDCECDDLVPVCAQIEQQGAPPIEIMLPQCIAECWELEYEVGICADMPSDYQNCLWNTCVHPGDADNNGIVEELDLLTIASGLGITGPPRPQSDSTFTPHFAYDWLISSPVGLDYKYADANGDGLISLADIAFVEQYLGLTHDDGLVIAIGNNQNFMQLNFDAETPLTNNIVQEIPIQLGNIGNSIESFHGVAFQIQYDTTFINRDSIALILDNSWIGNVEDLIYIVRNYPESGVIKAAIARQSFAPVWGYGQIGRIKVATEGNIIGKTNADIPIHFYLSGAQSSGYNGNVTNMLPAQATTVLHSTATYQPTITLPTPASWQIYPIPVTADRCAVVWQPAKNTSATAMFSLHTITGELLFSKPIVAGINTVSLPVTLPTGLYLASMQEEGLQISVQKILIIH